MTDYIPTGAMRFPVAFFKRSDVADYSTPTSIGLIETATAFLTVMCDIQPTGPVTYFNSINAEPLDGTRVGPITHRIFTRWLPYLDQSYIGTCTLTTPDGLTRVENYRVWRFMQLAGRQRFVQFDVGLESIEYPPAT